MKKNTHQPAAMPAVEARHLTMRYGRFLAVDDISFAVGRGEIFGFLGANGAGKTTTIRMLCGLLVPTAGRMMVAGLDGLTQSTAIKAKVGYMSQRFTLYNDLTVAENLAFAAALRKVPKPAFEAGVGRLFEFVGFEQAAVLNTLVSGLPGGVKQQLSLVAALLHDPEIVFLDEPTAGVSPVARARFWELIRRLARQGKTVFVTTHYLDEAENCRRIALMRAGKIIALDTPARLKQTTFPEPVLELEPGPGTPADWAEKIRLDERAARLEPYGLRYHAVILDAAAWRRTARRLPKTVRVRPVEPSLEDVFIRLVEGRNR